MILLLNGAFGIGKTTVARSLARRLRRGMVFDPELIGIPLQRAARLVRIDVSDFQDLRLWRTLTVIAIRVARLVSPNVIVPMAFSDAKYLYDIRRKLERFEPHTVHVCLVASLKTVHSRLRARGADPVRNRWEYERAAQCCEVHGNPEFGLQVATEGRAIEAVVDDVFNAVSAK